jgi:hypothetical protein
VAVSPATARVLARCNGFEVSAAGEIVGVVETPVFSGTKLQPDYLLVRLAGEPELRTVPPELVADVDPKARRIVLEGSAL